MPSAKPPGDDAHAAPQEAAPGAPNGAAHGAPDGAAHHVRPVITVRTLVAAGLILMAVVGLVFLLSTVLGTVLVAVTAIVFAEGIRPVVHWLRERRIPAPAGILIVYLGLAAFAALLVAVLVPGIVTQGTSLANNFPAYQKGFLSFFNNVENQFHFTVNINQQVGQILSAAQQILFTIGGTIFALAVDFVLVLVIAFMWLLTSDRLKHFVVDLIPVDQQAVATDIFREIGYRTGGYVRAVVINAVALGMSTGVACWILGLPSPLLLGIFASITGAIPIIGPTIGMIPPVLLAFTVSPAFALLVLGIMLLIALIDGNTVVPLVMNRVVSLPALAVVLALLIGGALQGLIGALLAVPVAAAIQVVTLRAIVPAVHHAQGRPDPMHETYHPDAAPADAGRSRGAGRRLLQRVRRS